MAKADQTKVQSELNPLNTNNDLAQSWTLFIDGSSTKNDSGVGIAMKSPE